MLDESENESKLNLVFDSEVASLKVQEILALDGVFL